MAASINFCTAEYGYNPLDDVLHDSLVHLVKNIRGDGAINVDKRKLLARMGVVWA